MNAAMDRRMLRRELGGWTLRGMLCAGPSACLAFAADFTRPVQIAAMVLGIACWIGASAWFSVWSASRPGWDDFGWALKISAGIKSAMSLMVALGWMLVAGGIARGGWYSFGVVPDMWLGVGALSLMKSVSGIRNHIGRRAGFALDHFDLFGWTLGTTLLQGAFIVLLLLLGAGLLFVAGRLLRRLGLRTRFSPTRHAG